VTMIRIIFITTFVSIFGLCGLTDAEMYQWTDENGVIHFSNDNVVYKAQGVTRTGEILGSPNQSEQKSSKENDDESEENDSETRGPEYNPSKTIIINGPSAQERRETEERDREKHEIYMEREKQKLECDRVKTEAIEQKADQDRRRNLIHR
jgi:hypothetical protein